MTITPAERARLEHALDEMALALRDPEPSRVCDALLLYERCIAIVRDRPAGERRVRSDNGTSRNHTPPLV